MEERRVLIPSNLGARNAYQANDVQKSRILHEMRHHSHIEENSESGEFLKAIIFGGIDGILTSFAIVSGSIGGELHWSVVVVLGVSSVVADGIGMAVGDYLSSKAYDQYVASEKEREHWEYQNYREGEIQEVVQIFVNKGMELTDAEHIVPILAQYEDIFVAFMVTEELGLQISKNNTLDLAINSFIMFLSFVFFGLFPLIPFLLGPLNLLSSHEMVQISCCCTAFALFLLGAIKSTFSSSLSWFFSGMETIALGGGCALVAYGVGKFANVIISYASSS